MPNLGQIIVTPRNIAIYYAISCLVNPSDGDRPRPRFSLLTMLQ